MRSFNKRVISLARKLILCVLPVITSSVFCHRKRTGMKHGCLVYTYLSLPEEYCTKVCVVLRPDVSEFKLPVNVICPCNKEGWESSACVLQHLCNSR